MKGTPELRPTGSRAVTVAIVDSGVNPCHPHVGGIVEAIGFDADGCPQADWLDRLGHGTAVAAAIHEKAPQARLLIVKIFDRSLGANIEALIAGVRWAIGRRADLVNLSLGTDRTEHEARLEEVVAEARAAGVALVAAGPQANTRWLPGALDGVVAVLLDWQVPRDRCLVERIEGRLVCRASGYPRAIPGVPPERNLQGLSFAVANATGWLARALSETADGSVDAVLGRLDERDRRSASVAPRGWA